MSLPKSFRAPMLFAANIICVATIAASISPSSCPSFPRVQDVSFVVTYKEIKRRIKCKFRAFAHLFKFFFVGKYKYSLWLKIYGGRRCLHCRKNIIYLFFLYFLSENFLSENLFFANSKNPFLITPHRILSLLLLFYHKYYCL